jgi:Protein kinase domain
VARAPNRTVSRDPAVGTVLGGCRIDAVLGRGGMAVVYRAEQLALGRRVALKVLSGALSHDPSFRARFQQEARLAASLDHRNVVPVYEAGEDRGHLYLVMRHIDGTDLRSLLQRAGALPPPRAARIVQQVAAALDAAHAKGLVHRDVKPANVMVCTESGGEDQVYLSDFGLTKPVDATVGLTRTGEWIGTPDYAAPEQIEGRRVDARTDVYGLGCVLFEALTGAGPYPRDTPMAKLWAHVNAPPPSVTATDRTVPPAFDAIVARALAKDPADRYASAGGLGRAAVAAAEGRPVAGEEDRSVATGKASPLPVTQPLAPAPRRAAVVPPTPRGRPAVTPAAARAAARPRATTVGGPQSPAAAPRGSRSRTPAALAALAALLVAGGLLAAVLLSSGGSDPRRAGSVPEQRSTAEQQARGDGGGGARTAAGSAAAPADDAADGQPAGTATAPSDGSGDGASAGSGASAAGPGAPSGYVAYAPAPGYRLERPAGWVVQKDAVTENDLPRYRSQWVDDACGCELIVDFIPGYGRTAQANAEEVPGGTVAPATLGTFDDVARRTALAGSRHEATYFVAVGEDNYAVKASAPSPATAEAIASRVAGSLSPAGG